MGLRQFKMGYLDGRPVSIEVEEVEFGKVMRKDIAPRMRAALAEARAQEMTVAVDSAWRSWEEQNRLYQAFKAGLPGAKPADPPGYSKHQSGVAVDLEFSTAQERERFGTEIAPKYGFGRPHYKEAWHFVAGPDPVVT